MSANEIANKVHAMIMFNPAALQADVLVHRSVGVDQIAEGTQLGVERIGVGRYKVHLVDKLDVFGGVASGSCAAGVILSSGIDVDGNWLVQTDTNAGAPTDASLAAVVLFRFPAQS